MPETKIVHNELGTENIGKLLRMYAIPGIIAMTASSLYNMVDSIYIGHMKDVGALAISGLGVTFPLMNLSTAIGTLVGIGSSTMVSVFLGQKNYGMTNKIFANSMALNTLFGLLFTALTIPFLEPILRLFGATDNTLPFASSYMVIILAANFITHLYFGLNSIIRASGNPRFAMGLTIFTVVFNSILDPVLIFGFDMGIAGAAWATVISQVLALCAELWFFSRKGMVPGFRDGKLFDLDLRVVGNIFMIGMGPFLMNTASCIVTLFINQQLLKYGGDLAIGAYGIINRIVFLVLMIIMGLNQGMQPIAGFNYGAKLYSRVRKTLNLTVLCATIVTCVGFILIQVFTKQAVGIFTEDPELMALSEKGLRIITLTFPIIGGQMVITNFFQCLGMVHRSITLSLSRQIIFLMPLLYTLPMELGVNGVFASFPISDTLAFVMAAAMMISIDRKFKKLNDGDDPTVLGGKIR